MHMRYKPLRRFSAKNHNLLLNNNISCSISHGTQIAFDAPAWDDPMLMPGVTTLPTSFDFSEDMITMKMVEVSQSIPIREDLCVEN
jgi:hypothetical protein